MRFNILTMRNVVLALAFVMINIQCTHHQVSSILYLANINTNLLNTSVFHLQYVPKKQIIGTFTIEQLLLLNICIWWFLLRSVCLAGWLVYLCDFFFALKFTILILHCLMGPHIISHHSWQYAGVTKWRHRCSIQIAIRLIVSTRFVLFIWLLVFFGSNFVSNAIDTVCHTLHWLSMRSETDWPATVLTKREQESQTQSEKKTC